MRLLKILEIKHRILNLKYNVLKAFHILWQRYELYQRIKQLQNLFAFLILVWVFGSLLTIFTEYLISDKPQDLDFYLQFFTYTVRTILSADFSDFMEFSILTSIISVFMVISGITVIGLFTGEIISMLVGVMEKNKYLPEKPKNFYFKNPMLICGNKNYEKIINDIKINTKNNYEIIIISKVADKIEKFSLENYHDVYYIKGDPKNRKILKQAIGENIKKKLSAIILSSEKDYDAIEISLAIEAFNEKVHTIIQLTNNSSLQYFNNSKINEYVLVKEYGTKLLSQAGINPGISKAYNNLLGVKGEDSSNETDARILKVRIGDITDLDNEKSYSIVKEIVSKKNSDLIIIGFEKYINKKNIDKHKIIINKYDKNENSITQINPMNKYTQNIGDLYFNVINSNPIFSTQTKLNINDKIVFIKNI